MKEKDMMCRSCPGRRWVEMGYSEGRDTPRGGGECLRRGGGSGDVKKGLKGQDLEAEWVQG